MHRLALIALPFLAACYRYAPIEAGAIQPGMGVRVRLSAAAAERLEPLLGTTDARLLSGVLISSSADTLVVEVPTRTQAAIGSAIRTLNQRVGVPRAALVEVEARSLDRVRTGAVVGAAAVVAGAFVFRSIKGDPGLDGGPGPGGGADLRFYLIRFHP